MPYGGVAPTAWTIVHCPQCHRSSNSHQTVRSCQCGCDYMGVFCPRCFYQFSQEGSDTSVAFQCTECALQFFIANCISPLCLSDCATYKKLSAYSLDGEHFQCLNTLFSWNCKKYNIQYHEVTIHLDIAGSSCKKQKIQCAEPNIICGARFSLSALRRARLPDRELVSSCPRKLAKAQEHDDWERTIRTIFSTLGVPQASLDPNGDRCFCDKCCDDKLIGEQGTPPKQYVLPKGWFLLGLRVSDDMREVLEKWHLSYHGTRSSSIASIVKDGLLAPGSETSEGYKVVIRTGHIPNERFIFSSPSPYYIAQPTYASPISGFQVALQCRVRPGTYTIQPETLAMRALAIDPVVGDDILEYVTTCEKDIAVTGVLIRTCEVKPSPEEAQKLMQRYAPFSYAALAAATQNFAETCLIGGGGFGKVYRCQLPDVALEVAIKAVPAGDADTAAHFEKEVQELSTHPHPNFVQMLGASVDGPTLCLVMKYMKGGSVRAQLARQPPLSWRQRLAVAVGAVRGLVYLHSTLNKVHRDVKPSNILVDLGAHTAVLCDFGLIRAAQTQAGKTDRTSKPVGTAAFMSHEALKGKITPKMDIYAMGVTLLELVTGKPAEGGEGGGVDAGCASAAASSSSSENIVIEMEEALEELEGGNPADALAFLDSRIRAPSPPAGEVEQVLQLASSCLNHKYNQRPDAKELLQVLERLLALAEAAEASVPSRMMAMLDLAGGREYWCSEGKRGTDEQKLFPVKEDSDEFAAVAADFLKTLPAASIDDLQRIENGYLHESFQLQAATLQKRIGLEWEGPKMRRMLFHGTEAVEPIINSTDGHGFLPLMTKIAIYGDGTYFARDARYSDGGYARELPNGQKQMLVVDVLVGRSARGKKGMKACPLLPGEQYVRYNSLVDNEDDPSIFVIHHSNQAYPAYLITYHK